MGIDELEKRVAALELKVAYLSEIDRENQRFYAAISRLQSGLGDLARGAAAEHDLSKEFKRVDFFPYVEGSTAGSPLEACQLNDLDQKL